MEELDLGIDCEQFSVNRFPTHQVFLGMEIRQGSVGSSEPNTTPTMVESKHHTDDGGEQTTTKTHKVDLCDYSESMRI